MTTAAYATLLFGALAGGFVSGLAGFGTALMALGIWLYVLPVVVLALWFDTYVSMARFALTAFPLLVAVVRPVKGPAFLALLGVSAALMATLFIFIGSTLLLTP